MWLRMLTGLKPEREPDLPNQRKTENETKQKKKNLARSRAGEGEEGRERGRWWEGYK